MEPNSNPQPPNNPVPPYTSPALLRETKTSSGGGWRNVISTLLILLAAPIIAIVLTAFVFQSYEVDGPSMETTLQNKDRLIVLKLGKTWSKITGKNYIPKRGEIIIFSQMGEFDLSANSSQRQLIKRVIGLPGDRVVVADGKITVYNKEHPEGFNPDTTSQHAATINKFTPGNDDVVVPEGYVYVCGDNRLNSLDSRNFGPIKSSEIVGKLALRIFPLSKVDSY